jgi:hypothetical protein
MKNDKIKNLRGNRELLKFAEEDLESFSIDQSVPGFSRPVKIKNKHKKGWFDHDGEGFQTVKKSNIKNVIKSH